MNIRRRRGKVFFLRVSGFFHAFIPYLCSILWENFFEFSPPFSREEDGSFDLAPPFPSSPFSHTHTRKPAHHPRGTFPPLLFFFGVWSRAVAFFCGEVVLPIDSLPEPHNPRCVRTPLGKHLLPVYWIKSLSSL